MSGYQDFNILGCVLLAIERVSLGDRLLIIWTELLEGQSDHPRMNICIQIDEKIIFKVSTPSKSSINCKFISFLMRNWDIWFVLKKTKIGFISHHKWLPDEGV